MPRKRRTGRRKSFKLKLRKKTIYTIFGIGFLLSGVFMLLSVMNPAGSGSVINAQLEDKFGGLSVLVPFALFFIGFLL